MKVKVGVVQDNPIFFDKEKTLSKLENIVAENAALGCQLLVFPESFVPGYPRGFDFGAKIGSRTNEGKAIYAEYYANSVSLEGEDLLRLTEISKIHGAYLVVGITEKQETKR